MHPTKKTARLAGFLYLLVTITGIISLMYLPGKLFVQGDSAATANNILVHQSLFKTYVLLQIVSELLFISVVLVLYEMLKQVNKRYAAVMVLLVLIPAPLAFLSVANQVSMLAFLRGAEFIQTLDKPQRDAIAMLLFYSDSKSAVVSEIFWGLWLLPLGVLVYRSTFLPRFIGVWLVINGFAYVILSVAGVLTPDNMDGALKYAMPALLGEVALTLWLLIVGVREKNDRLTDVA